MATDKANIPTWIWWIGGILIFTIIYCIVRIMQNHMYNGEVLLQYIQNISLFLSIILSIFATVYTYVSSIQLSNHSEKIGTRMQEVKDCITNINDTMTQQHREIQELHKNLSALNTKFDLANPKNNSDISKKLNDVKNIFSSKN
jgi:uncharacterized coiled-coil protein SlyX